ncbi:sensor histidine kinase [Paenibacillus sp. JDR-2]|uniref:sensor histidine kinase n=1 Tax=Paenibacillus sp. (strain JDR-2) TaxID=324057 RepID=UPI000166A53B|nr:sensor histidine kinase [Paenibacillus sp. JDR-2]ACT00332.1 putative sensor with HAMP domain [Paenibacillus sp. JDR-2]
MKSTKNNLLRKMSFKSKLFLTYLLLILIPTVGSSIWIYQNLIQDLVKERNHVNNQQLLYAETDINNKIDEAEKIGYMVSVNTTLNDVLSQPYYDTVTWISIINQTVKPMASWIEATTYNIGKFRILVEDDEVPESDFFNHSSSFIKESWYQDMKAGTQQGKAYWRHDTAGQYYLYYALSSSSYSNNGAYLELMVRGSYLFESLQAKETLNSGIMVIQDNKGQLLYNDTETTMPQLDHTDYSVLTKPIRLPDANLVSMTPNSVMMMHWTKSRNVFLVILAVSVTILAASAYLMAVFLMRRIKQILAGIRKIQKGDFDIEIPVHGEDEIDMVGHNINVMAYKINELIERVYKTEIAQREAELYALQAQINPHFLFNALETMRMMAEFNDQEELSEAITALGSIMRYSISHSEKKQTFVWKELEHLNDYLKVQNLMHNGRIQLLTDFSDRINRLPIPSFIFQPIVENAIKHGFRNQKGNLILSISITEYDGAYLCRIADNGTGMDKERLAFIQRMLKEDVDEVGTLRPSEGGGVGLLNIQQRIRFNYGKDYGLEIESGLSGTVVSIRFPDIIGGVPRVQHVNH